MAHAGASTADNHQLQQDARWTASQFNHLEQFIYDFLVGGASAGESVRLKLQTPLFVADALLAAAQQTLRQELELVTKVGASSSAQACGYCGGQNPPRQEASDHQGWRYSCLTRSKFNKVKVNVGGQRTWLAKIGPF